MGEKDKTRKKSHGSAPQPDIEIPSSDENHNTVENTTLVKTSLHTEMQKFGEKPKPALPLFDSLDAEMKKDVTAYNISVIGIDNTASQNQALFAIQKLLTETNYRGNMSGQQMDRRNGFLYQGYLPCLRVPTGQYLDAYGVKKYQTERGKEEYSGQARREALQALKDLNDKRYLFFYERRYWVTDKKGKKEERSDIIKTIKPLISITEGYEALTKLERDIVLKDKANQNTDEKLKFISIEPCPILVDQIDSYFVLKPANYREEIALTSSKFKESKYTYLFIDYLMAQAELKRRTHDEMIHRISLEELAYKLRLECYLKTRNYKRIRQIVTNGCKTAKELGYLLDYTTTAGTSKKELQVFILNPPKFDRALAILEQRKIMEQKEDRQQES